MVVGWWWGTRTGRARIRSARSKSGEELCTVQQTEGSLQLANSSKVQAAVRPMPPRLAKF